MTQGKEIETGCGWARVMMPGMVASFVSVQPASRRQSGVAGAWRDWRTGTKDPAHPKMLPPRPAILRTYLWCCDRRKKTACSGCPPLYSGRQSRCRCEAAWGGFCVTIRYRSSRGLARWVSEMRRCAGQKMPRMTLRSAQGVAKVSIRHVASGSSCLRVTDREIRNGFCSVGGINCMAVAFAHSIVHHLATDDHRQKSFT